MAFDQTDVDDLRLARSGCDLVVSWTSSAPAGTTFQVYLDRRLAWWGASTRARFPWPRQSVRVDVGAVAAGQGPTDLSGSLPAAPADRARLDWLGGTFLSPTIQGFRVFGSTAAGQPVSYSAPVDVLPAYHGATTDGWGLGGYDQGGWGQAASAYSWTSGPLGPGLWGFAVVPFDAAGNPAGTPATAAVTIAAPPRPPAPDALGRRLTYSLDAPTRVATLHWLPSPA